MDSPIQYSITKAGVISMTKYLAKYYGKNNIRVNCLSPGGIKDDQPKNLLQDINYLVMDLKDFLSQKI